MDKQGGASQDGMDKMDTTPRGVHLSMS